MSLYPAKEVSEGYYQNRYISRSLRSVHMSEFVTTTMSTVLLEFYETIYPENTQRRSDIARDLKTSRRRPYDAVCLLG